MRRTRLGCLAILALALVVLFVAVFSHSGQVAIKTLLVVPHLLDAPTKPLDALTGTPSRSEVVYTNVSSLGQPVVGDLFRPAEGGRHGAIVLSLGVRPVERSDPRLRSLADGLARMGVVLLITDSPDLRAGRTLPSEIDALVEAFQYLRGQPFVDPRRVGYAGFSVGASLVTVAAADARVRDQVAFVNFFGGYYDLGEVGRAISTGTIRDQGREEPWESSDLTRELFPQLLIDTLESPQDRQTLMALLAQGRLAEAQSQPSLSPGAQTIAALISARDPAQVDQLLGQLPEPTVKRFSRLSPRYHLAGLRTRLFLMHDTGDHFLPYVESRRFVRDLQARNYPHLRYTEFSLFEHVTPTKALDVLSFTREVHKLYWHMFWLLREAI